VPWQGMIWVTWRQHRGLLIGVLAAFVTAVLAMLAVGLRIHQDYAALAACRPAASPACARLMSYFDSTDWHEGNGIHAAVQVAPALLAMVAGPPILAREFENGTYRYAWTQGIGRVRWTATRLAVLAAYLALAAATRFYLRGHYPVSTFWPRQLLESGWLLALSALLVAGTIQLIRPHAA
jgi:hypothetical protein